MLILILLTSYILPIILNFTKLRFCDFVKGIAYSIFLSPTYVNVFTIYAISNIHDVSWGSRPSRTDNLMKASENKKKVLYENFRSNFLVIWIAVNLFVGWIITQFARSGNKEFIFYLGFGLSIVVAIKIVFALFHTITTYYHSYYTNRHMQTKSSAVFKDVKDLVIAQSTHLLLTNYRAPYNLQKVQKYDSCRARIPIQEIRY